MNTQQANQTKKTAAPPRVDQPENSTELRVICGALAVISLSAACRYTHVPPIPTVICIWMTLAGSCISYYMRNSRNMLVTGITVIGLVIVLSIFAQEMYVQFYAARMDMLIPFIHVLAGLLALHTWDLRTRLDLNANALIGLGVMCCTLVLGRDLLFGFLVCTYIWLCATLLYFEAAARTKSSGRYTPSEPSSPSRMIMNRESKGTAIVPISTIPILGLFFFLCLPRVNSIFDVIAANVSRYIAPHSVALPGVGTNGPIASSLSGSGLGMATDNRIRNGVGTADGSGGRVIGGGPRGKGGKGNLSAGAPVDSGQGSTGSPDANGSASVKSAGLPPENELFFRNKEAVKHDDELLFKVSAPGDFFYRRLAFDKYDGHKWTVTRTGMLSKCRKLNGGVYQELGGVPSLFLPPDYPSAQITQEFTVCSNMGRVIPVVAVPQKIDFPSDPVIVDDNGVIKTETPMKPGTTYRVYSQVATYNLDDMRKTPDDPELQERARKEFATCLAVADEVPGHVRDLAINVAGKDGNWFTKSERILKFLRTNYKYSNDGDDVPKDHDLVEAFLFGERKSGACGPFASAFTIMCRVNGIPARVIGGFAPGEYNSLTGVREVHGKHGHAWSEAWIPKWGWVPFDAIPSGVLPTPPEEDTSFLAQVQRSLANMQASLNPPQQLVPPSRPADQASPGAVPVQDAPQQYPATGTQTTTGAKGQAGPGVAEGGTKGGKGTTTATAGATGNATPPAPGLAGKDGKEPPIPLPGQADNGDQMHSKIFWWLQGLVVLALIPATLLIAQAIRSAYLHFKAIIVYQRTAKPSTVLYLRVVDDLKRFKISRSPSDTAEEFSVRFLSAVHSGMPVHPELPPLLQHFMQAYTDDRFGTPAGSEQRRAELEEISDKIHNLARMKVS